MANLTTATKSSSAPKKTDEYVQRIPDIPDNILSNTIFP